MITPEDILNIDTWNVSIDEIESRLDKSILRNHDSNIYYEEANITDAIPISIADAIAMRYIRAGWNYVFYRVNKKYNFTNFVLSMNDPVYFSTAIKFRKYIQLRRNDAEVNRH